MAEFPDLLVLQAEAAFRDAARVVVERAKRCGSSVITMQDGEMRAISGDELDQIDLDRPGQFERLGYTLDSITADRLAAESPMAE